MNNDIVDTIIVSLEPDFDIQLNSGKESIEIKTDDPEINVFIDESPNALNINQIQETEQSVALINIPELKEILVSEGRQGFPGPKGEKGDRGEPGPPSPAGSFEWNSINW